MKGVNPGVSVYGIHARPSVVEGLKGVVAGQNFFAYNGGTSCDATFGDKDNARRDKLFNSSRAPWKSFPMGKPDSLEAGASSDQFGTEQ